MSAQCHLKKSPSRVIDRDKGVAGRNKREKYFPDKGSLTFSPGKSKIFTKRKQKTIVLVALANLNLLQCHKDGLAFAKRPRYAQTVEF